MRLICALIICSTATAWADAKIQGFIPGLERELAGCRGQQSGNDKVTARAAAYVKTAEGDKSAGRPARSSAEGDAKSIDMAEAERDAAALASGAAKYAEYCNEVAGFVDYLKEQAKVPYKTVEREIDTRDNKLRTLRREAKKQVEELAPLTRKWIAKVVPPVAAVDDKRTPGKFPSGRTIDLPALPGTWKVGGSKTTDSVEYRDKAVTASISTSPLTGTCEDRRGQAMKNPNNLDLVDVAVAKDAGITWAMRYTRKQAAPVAIVEMCGEAGKVVAFAEVAPATTPLVDDFTKVMLRMFALRKK
jgi:hypothetical protein